MSDSASRNETFVLQCGHETNIPIHEDDISTCMVLARAHPHPIVLECVSDTKMSRRFHIIGELWTSVVMERGDYMYRVSNPSCNKFASTLQLRSWAQTGNQFSQLVLQSTPKRTNDVYVGAGTEKIFLGDEDMSAMFPTAEMRKWVDKKINIRIQLADRRKLFSSFDKITINFYLKGYLFLSYVASVGEDFILTVHDGENTSSSRKMISQYEHVLHLPLVTFSNPWRLGGKQLMYECWSMCRIPRADFDPE